MELNLNAESFDKAILPSLTNALADGLPEYEKEHFLGLINSCIEWYRATPHVGVVPLYLQWLMAELLLQTSEFENRSIYDAIETALEALRCWMGRGESKNWPDRSTLTDRIRRTISRLDGITRDRESQKEHSDPGKNCTYYIARTTLRTLEVVDSFAVMQPPDVDKAFSALKCAVDCASRVISYRQQTEQLLELVA